MGERQGRHDRIHLQLNRLQKDLVIYDWWVNAPGGVGLRWHVHVPAVGSRQYTTAEVEAFIEGASAGTKENTR